VAVVVVLLLWAHLSVNGEARPLTDNRGNSSGIDLAIYQYISSGNNGHISIQHSVPYLRNKLDTFRICAEDSSCEHAIVTSSEFTDNMAL